MDKRYQPADIESKWYKEWEGSGAFAPANTKGKESFTISLPPPNVTGTLHMGHAFQVALMDCLIRYQRMNGRNVLWQAGTDHAGIATQMLVERKLLQDGVERSDIGREQFIDEVWKWKEQSGGTITQQLRRLGASLDWDNECFTMDEDLSKAVRHAFITLYEEGLIYRGKRLVNWDTVLQTAVSDLEVVNEEKQGKLWHIRYPLADGDGHLVVATTRPETMFGDSAVAVHPEDERYQSLIGKEVILPQTQRAIKIIADESVDMEFGTGCVKITPAHDFNDYELGKRHDLELINIMNPDATLNDAVPSAYQGLDRYAARKKLLAALSDEGLLEKEEAYTHTVPYGDRSRSVIEPLLTDQWFVKTKPLADLAIDAIKSEKIRFYPKNWTKESLRWLENIEDWCISRQIWWGHRIPVWYDDDGNTYVGESEKDVREKHGIADTQKLRQDEDVLDTWFSSGLWPFSTLGWPDEKSERLQTFYPNSVLVTGFDIIFFWAARMMMMGLKLTGKVPFHEVYIHGLVRDAQGQKMSKSKGNVLDPIDLIDGISAEALLEKQTSSLMQPEMAERIRKDTKKHYPDGIESYGTDAMRFTFIAMASTGRDINFDVKRIEGYRNFCNKLWNAARFTTMMCEGKEKYEYEETFLPCDTWIEEKFAEVVDKCHAYLAEYRFDLFANEIYHFVWDDFCDWYLEFVKLVQNEDLWCIHKDAKASNRRTLLDTLEGILRLIHPVVPYISEEIWQDLKPLTERKEKYLQDCSCPEGQKEEADIIVRQIIEDIRNYVSTVRRIRSEANIAPQEKVSLLLKHWNKQDETFFTDNDDAIKGLASVSDIQLLAEDDEEPLSATAMVKQVKVIVPISIDIEAEQKRLNKEIARLQELANKMKAQTENEDFVSKAPAEVVEKKREQVREFEDTIAQHRAQLENLERAQT